MSDPAAKRYNIAATVRKAIAAQRTLGHPEPQCSALLTRAGKRLNSIERAPAQNFTRRRHQYRQGEQPDEIRIELRNAAGDLLWIKHFDLPTPPDAPAPPSLSGLDPAGIDALLQEKINALKDQEQREALRIDNERLTQENSDLQAQLDGLQATVEAKSKVEYYANMLGLAFPGLAQLLAATPLGGTLGALAGITPPPSGDHTPPAPEG